MHVNAMRIIFSFIRYIYLMFIWLLHIYIIITIAFTFYFHISYLFFNYFYLLLLTLYSVLNILVLSWSHIYYAVLWTTKWFAILHLSNKPRCDCAAKLQFFQWISKILMLKKMNCKMGGVNDWKPIRYNKKYFLSVK